MKLIHDVLADAGACEESLEWAFDLPESTCTHDAWEKCPDPLWLFWLLTEMYSDSVVSATLVVRAALAVVTEGARELPKEGQHEVLRKAIAALNKWAAVGEDTEKLAEIRRNVLIEKQMCEYRDAAQHYAGRMRRGFLYGAVTRLLYSVSSRSNACDAVDLYHAAGDAAAVLTYGNEPQDVLRDRRMNVANIVRAAVPWSEWEQALRAWATTRRLIVE